VANRKTDPFARVKLAKSQLRMVALTPIPAPPPLRGATAEDRVRFVVDCFSAHRKIAELYGWRNHEQESFDEHSLLGAMLEHRSNHARDIAESAPLVPASDEIGDPPDALLQPYPDPSRWSLGIEPLTRSDLREVLDGIAGMLHRGNEGAEPLSDDELYGIAHYADVWVTYSPIYWGMIVTYLPRQLMLARSRALELTEWVEKALSRHKPERRSVSRGAGKGRRAWVDKALALMKDNPNLSAHAVASVVGVAVSTVTKHPVLGTQFKKRAKGILGEDLGAEVLSGDERVLTKDKLPARSIVKKQSSD
jgi:hypothetical protein